LVTLFFFFFCWGGGFCGGVLVCTSGAGLLALTPMNFPTDWGLSVEQEGAMLAATHTLRSSMSSASTAPSAAPLTLDLSLLLFWPKTLVEGARTARSHRYPFESPLCVIGGYAKLRDQLGSEEFERLLPSKLRTSALEALTAEARVSVPLTRYFLTRPLRCLWLLDRRNQLLDLFLFTFFPRFPYLCNTVWLPAPLPSLTHLPWRSLYCSILPLSFSSCSPYQLSTCLAALLFFFSFFLRFCYVKCTRCSD